MFARVVSPIRTSGAALLLVLGLRCAPAQAAGSSAAGFTSPETGTRLSAGTLGTASWSSTKAIAAAREVELLLSLDGGESFPIRLTRDLHPGVQSALFRVPRLPTPHARLALRIGSEDPQDDEVIQQIGPEFAIDPEPVPALEPLVSVCGEWRTHDAIDGPVSAFPGPASLASRSDGVSALTLSVDLGDRQTAPEISTRLSATLEPAQPILDITPLPAPHCRSQVASPKLE